jgi:hypothetical protein
MTGNVSHRALWVTLVGLSGLLLACAGMCAYVQQCEQFASLNHTPAFLLWYVSCCAIYIFVMCMYIAVLDAALLK